MRIRTWDVGDGREDALEFVSVTNGLTGEKLKHLEYRRDGVWIAEAEDAKQIPSQFVLEQNYPNPFNSTTKIRYGIPNAANVVLDVYNLLGEKVAKLVDVQHQKPGYHEILFDAEGLSSGVYFYAISAGQTRVTRKGILLR